MSRYIDQQIEERLKGYCSINVPNGYYWVRAVDWDSLVTQLEDPTKSLIEISSLQGSTLILRKDSIEAIRFVNKEQAALVIEHEVESEFNNRT